MNSSIGGSASLCWKRFACSFLIQWAAFLPASCARAKDLLPIISILYQFNSYYLCHGNAITVQKFHNKYGKAFDIKCFTLPIFDIGMRYGSS